MFKNFPNDCKLCSCPIVRKSFPKPSLSMSSLKEGLLTNNSGLRQSRRQYSDYSDPYQDYNQPQMAYQLNIQLNKIESQMQLLSRECRKIKELNSIIMNGNTNGKSGLNDFYSTNNSNSNNISNSNSKTNQLKPIQMFNRNNLKAKSNRNSNSNSKTHNDHYLNMSSMINATKQHEQEVNMLDVELNKMKEEFEKRFARISSKQKLQLDGLNYVIQKSYERTLLLNPVNNQAKPIQDSSNPK